MNTTVIPKMLSAKEVASILKIGYVKTLEMMRYGKIPAVKLAIPIEQVKKHSMNG